MRGRSGRARRRKADEQRAAARALETEGCFIDAIELWSKINRTDPLPDVESHLIALRHRAANDIGRPTPSAVWDRVYDDPFPHVSDVPPEITRDKLTAEVLGGAIRHHGCLLVRGLFDIEVSHDLASVIRKTFDAFEASQAGAPISETTPWYAPDPEYASASATAAVTRAMSQGHGAIFAADSPRGFFKLVDALHATRVPTVAAEYLGEQPLLTVDKCSLRQMQPQPAPAWHQDGSFLYDGVRTVNAWIALSDCGPGTDKPGLEILPRRLEGLVDFGRPGSRVGIEVLVEDVRRAGDGIPSISPKFCAGDALLFDQLFLHSPGSSPDFTRPRYALECWMFPPSSCEQSYVPIAL